MVKKLDLEGGERVLELGASTCWATQQWVEYGCEAVALDVTKNLYYGIKSGQLWMDDRDSYFERMLCDMQKMPFEDSSFDIVFACAAMHHSSDIKTAFREIGRILKQGGRFACIAEPLTNIIGETQMGEREIELGINEKSYTIFEWRRAIRGGGMKPEPFLDYHFRDDKTGLAGLRDERGYSPNPIKRIIKSLAFSDILPARLRVNMNMLTSQMSCFNVVAEKK
jgi:SAM-dependent methyltransferase